MRSLGIFLLVAIGGAWSVWAIAYLVGAFDAGPGSASAQGAVVLGAFAPALACLVVRRWVAREGFSDAGLHPRLQSSWPYFVFGWLLPLPVVVAVVALARILDLFFVHEDGSPVLLLGSLVASVALAPLFFGEEFGWRGYLQLRMFADRPIVAAIATGLIWGVFHYPLIFLGFEGYENPAIGLVIFPVFTILMSII